MSAAGREAMGRGSEGSERLVDQGLLQASFLPSAPPPPQCYSNLAIGAASGTRAGELVRWVQLVHLQVKVLPGAIGTSQV